MRFPTSCEHFFRSPCALYRMEIHARSPVKAEKRITTGRGGCDFSDSIYALVWGV